MAFKPVSVATSSTSTFLLRNYFNFKLLGLENVNADQPALYVSNHPFAQFDVPMMISELYKDSGIYLRPLADKVNAINPLWHKMIKKTGGVIATKQNCQTLMNEGEHILVYPGGSREVLKNRDEINLPVWGERNGFARIAIENNYPIIPVASLGGDEAYQFILDNKDMKNTLLGKALKFTGISHRFLRDGELLPPIVRGIGPTLIPKPQPYYVMLGEPILTQEYQPNSNETNEVKALTYSAIVNQMKTLKELREKDNKKHPFRTFINRHT